MSTTPTATASGRRSGSGRGRGGGAIVQGRSAPPLTASTGAAAATAAARASHADLVTAVRRQLEFCFSAENLAQDADLASSLSTKRMMPVEAAVALPRMQALGATVALVIEASMHTNRVTLEVARDASVHWIGPAVPGCHPNQATLVFRGVPPIVANDFLFKQRVAEATGGIMCVSAVPVSGKPGSWFANFSNGLDASAACQLLERSHLWGPRAADVRFKQSCNSGALRSDLAPVPFVTAATAATAAAHPGSFHVSPSPAQGGAAAAMASEGHDDDDDDAANRHQTQLSAHSLGPVEAAPAQSFNPHHVQYHQQQQYQQQPPVAQLVVGPGRYADPKLATQANIDIAAALGFPASPMGVMMMFSTLAQQQHQLGAMQAALYDQCAALPQRGAAAAVRAAARAPRRGAQAHGVARRGAAGGVVVACGSECDWWGRAAIEELGRAVVAERIACRLRSR